MIKPFSGQVVFCFAILRAISAYNALAKTDYPSIYKKFCVFQSGSKLFASDKNHP